MAAEPTPFDQGADPCPNCTTHAGLRWLPTPWASVLDLADQLCTGLTLRVECHLNHHLCHFTQGSQDSLYSGFVD